MSDEMGLGQFRASEFENAVNHFAGFVEDSIAEWRSLDVDEDHRDEEGIAYELESLALLLRMAMQVRDEVGYGGTFTVRRPGFSLPLMGEANADAGEPVKPKRKPKRKAKPRKKKTTTAGK